MRIFYFAGLLLCCSICSAQTNFPVSSIDQSLTTNANAVVRLDESVVDVSSRDKMVVQRKRVITILKKAGESSINPYAHYDKRRKLSDISAVIFDENGIEIKKIKKRDFLDVSAVDGGTLYGDSRVKYFRYTPTAYPYTIAFSYTYTTPNTAFLPRWMPVDDYMVSTEKSVYSMTIAQGLKWRKKEKNFKDYPIKNLSKGNTLTYEMVGMPAQKREMMSPAFYNFEPQVMVALDDFHLEGVDGSASDWKSMGQWQHDYLLVNRDKLPQNTVNLISDRLQGISDKVEKVKSVYQYVQDNTRYISVQLGIGGWQPISAQEVDEVKYGDCKGLTNYTKALLKSQGIEAYYSVVYAGGTKKGMEKDFACMQGNHVILNVPNGEEDIWLECTSQKIPFGFLSDFTDDRDVLVVTPQGGKIKHTEAYLNDENLQQTNAVFKISPEGDLKGKVAIVTKAIQYDDHVKIENMAKPKRIEHYREYWDNINGLVVLETKFQNNKEEVEFTEVVTVEGPSYAKKIEGELLLKPNAFNLMNFVPDRYRDRKTPFEISRGFTDVDDFKIEIPQGHVLETLPEPIKITGKYGDYSMQLEKINETELRYTRKLSILKGHYPKEEYADYRSFMRKIRKADNLKIIINQL